MKHSIGLLPTPSAYTRLLLLRLPEQTAALLADTGLTADAVLHEPFITVIQQLQIFRNVKAGAKRDDWALDFGRQLSISSHGSLGFAALSAPTLGEGIEVLGQFARIRGPNFEFQTRQDADHLLLEIGTSLWPQEDLAPWLVEILLQVIAAYVEAVLGRQLAESTFMFTSPPPPYVALYEEYFHGRCVFNAPVNAVVLDAKLAQLPCPLYDEKTYRASLIRCRAALDILLSPDDVVARVQNLLSSHFDRACTASASSDQFLPRMEDIASTLCMSPRTLIRQLAAQDTTFRQLLDQEQREVAGKLLGHARYSISEVGYMLGYSDVTNFNRAFRRLFGMSPSDYRRQLS